MPVSKNRQFAKIANDVAVDGTLTAAAISSDVTLGGATIYASRSNLPTAGNTAGDQAFTTDTNRLYIWNGSGWYNVALLNVAPSIQSVTDSDGNSTPFVLSIEGATTTITITAVDSDGDPVTYAATADSDFAGLASLSQTDNVFTITPFSQDSATTTTGTITFTATDGVNVASSGVQTFRLFFVSALWDETVLSIGTNSANGLDNSTFVDRSSNAYTVTTTGSPVQTAFHPYLDNWSSEFSGSEWIQTVSTNSAFDFSAGGDFTIEMWVKDNLTADGVRTIMNMKSGSYGFLFRRHSSNRWELYYNGSNRTYLYIADYGSLTDWYHMAITLQSGQLRWFVNGQEGFTTSSITQSSYNFTTLDLGSYSNGNWNGYISNVRVVKGTALYTSNFTPPTEKLTAVSGTTFLAHQSNRFIDNGGNNEPITISAGTLKVSAYNPFGQGYEYASGENKGSVYLNGSSSVDGGASINPSSGCCIEGWAYVTAVSSYGFFFSTEQGNSGFYPRWYVGHDNSGNWRVSPGDATDNNLTSYPLVKNQWNHWALTNDGSTSRLFANGKLIYTKSVTPTGESLNFNISKYGDTLQYTLYGYISDFRAATTIPTAYQTSSTTLDTQVFTPPSSPGGISGAGYYLPMDNAGIFDKTGNNTLTLAGDASTSNTQTKYADTAMNFDGSGDRIQKLGGIDVSMSSFTIEGWIYPASWSSVTNQAMFAFNRSSDGSNVFVYAAKGLYYGQGSSDYWTGTGLSTNQWSHVAVTYDGTTVKAYENGTEVLSQSHTFSVNFSDCDFVLGSEFDAANGGSPGNYLNGYIENFQILSGVVKYTANFTVPSQEQGRTYQAES